MIFYDVLNYELYFYSMENKNINFPIGKIWNKIIDQFSSYNNLKKEFIKNAYYLVYKIYR